MAIPRSITGIPRSPSGIALPSNAAPITPGVIKVLWLYGDVASNGTIPSGGNPFQQMRLNDNGNEGFADFAGFINSMVGPNGETYEISEMYDVDFDPATDLNDITVLWLASSQRVFTAQEVTTIFNWGQAANRGLIAFSDSALGGGSGASGGGYQNQRGQLARAPIFDDILKVAVDQVDGTKQWNIAASHPISDSSVLTWEGEGHSPCVLHATGGATSIVDYDDNTLNHDQGVVYSGSPYTGTISILASHQMGSFRRLYIGDRNWGWKAGDGSNIFQFDNTLFAQNTIQWAAHQR